MSRRMLVLLGLLATSAVALVPFWPDFAAVLRKIEWQFRPPSPLPPQATAQIDDSAGALSVARGQIEDEIDRFGRDLGIGLHIVTTTSAGDPQVLAESLLASETRHPFHATGAVVLVLPIQGSAMGIAVSQEIARAAPPLVVFGVLASHVGPLLAEPLLGVALASGLERLRDFLLTSAASGSLELARPVFDRSIVARVRERQRVSESRCGYAAREPSADVSGSVEAFDCALLRGELVASGTLFTEPSRIQIARRPPLAFESRVRGAALEAGRPWVVTQSGDRAVVRPKRPTPDFVPVLLVREQGRWRVDLVEMGKTFRRREWEQWKQANASGPYWLALGAKPEAGEFDEDLAPIELWGEPLDDAIARLEESDGPVAKRRLAEILLRNVWLPDEALLQWDEALALAPTDLSMASDFARRAEYLGHPLLGAIAIAPFGPPAAQRLAELLLRGGSADAGATMLRRANEWRNAREAKRSTLSPEPEESI
jgi:hypothetical protein